MSRADKLLLEDIADSYVKNVNIESDKVTFTNVNGRTISIPVLKSNPNLTVSESNITLYQNGSKSVTTTHVGGGTMSVSFIEGTDCAVIEINDSTITFTGSVIGQGTYNINIGETDTHGSTNSTITITVSEIDPSQLRVTSITATRTSVTVQRGESDTITATAWSVSPEGAVAVYDIQEGPSWVTIDSDTGVVSIEPPADLSAAESHRLVVRVRARIGNVIGSDSAQVSISINVTVPITPKDDW